MKNKYPFLPSVFTFILMLNFTHFCFSQSSPVLDKDISIVPSTLPFCASKSTAPWEIWISNVKFNTLNNTSEKFKDYATLGFSDYSNLSTAVTKGQTYPLSITPNLSWSGYLPNVFCRAWIDFNNNKIFEDSEKVLEKHNTNPLISNVLIPSTATLGKVQMRISVKWGSYPTACETFEKGEVEDYTIEIKDNANTLPDLTLVNLSIPTQSVQQGQTLNWKVDIKNIGTGNAPSNFSVKAYISKDNILSEDDVQDGIISTGNFDAGFSITQVPGASTILPTLSVGQYYLILKVDADNQISESDENNNVITSTTTFAIISNPNSNLDLSITALPTTIVENNAGNLTDYPFATAVKLKYRYTITNATAAQSDSLLYFDVYVSRDSALSSDDYRRFRFGGAMGPDRTVESDVFVLPYRDLPNGKYFVFIKIDGPNSFNEINKANNVSEGIPFEFYGLRCDSTAKVPWGDWISNVKFSTINNTSTQNLLNSNGQFTAGYSPFATTISTTIERGKIYPLSITSSASWSGRLANHFYAAWIDFNGDGDFDDSGEKVYQGLGTNGISMANITIPYTATLGKTIMRVAVRNGGYPETCTAYNEGEVEDYWLNIQDGALNSCDNDVTPPVFANCPRDISVTALPNSTTSAAVWVSPTATDNCTASPIITTNHAGGGIFFIGSTAVIYTAKDAQNNTATCTFNINVASSTPPTTDIAVSINATPNIYRQWNTNSIRVTATNTSATTATNIKIELPFPDKTVTGGATIATMGIWEEWCTGGVKCYTWTIQSLTANTQATLDIPLFIQNITGNITITTTLFNTVPLDANRSNNSATFTLTPAPISQALASYKRTQPSQYIPIVIQTVAPNPTEGDVIIEVESLVEKDVRFDFYNTLGKIVKSDNKHVKKGDNRLEFDFWNTQNGIYFIQTSEGQGRGVPLKFVKM